jgi:GT2 family glycosyltransferase
MRQQPPYAISMNWASPRKVLDEVGCFDETLLRCQDVDLTYRVMHAHYGLAYVDDAIVYHRNRPTVRAVLREAHLHGRGARAVRRLHADYINRFPPTPRYAARILARLRGLRDVRNFRLALFVLVFDLGKISGELRGEMK